MVGVRLGNIQFPVFVECNLKAYQRKKKQKNKRESAALVPDGGRRHEDITFISMMFMYS